MSDIDRMMEFTNFLSAIGLFASICLIIVILFGGFLFPTNIDNELDVVHNLGYETIERHYVPYGQTISFKWSKDNDQFVNFTQFLNQEKPEVVYYLDYEPRVPSWASQRPCIYFISNDIIYKYWK